jgi:thiamine pyrophosphate-dependent acetolactate synthase large subunit-like protein
MEGEVVMRPIHIRFALFAFGSAVLSSGLTCHDARATEHTLMPSPQTVHVFQLPITFVIIKNGRYQALEEFGQHFGLSHTLGTKLPALDFVALATGHGIEGCRVDRPDALEGVLSNALSGEKPMLVEVDVI